jgi:hypothetical protein
VIIAGRETFCERWRPGPKFEPWAIVVVIVNP